MNDLVHDLRNARPIDLARERVEALAKTCNIWIAAHPGEIATEDDARDLQTYIEQLDGEIKKLDAEEKAEKAPLRKALGAIGLAYQPLRLVLATARSLIAPKRTAWLDRERRRINAEKAAQQAEAKRLAGEAEEEARRAAARPTVENLVAAQAAQQRQEQAAALAAAPPARAQLRGEYSTRAASIRTTWRAEIVDPLLCLIYFQEHPDILETLQKLANREAPQAHKDGREIPGCRLVEREIAA